MSQTEQHMTTEDLAATGGAEVPGSGDAPASQRAAPTDGAEETRGSADETEGDPEGRRYDEAYARQYGQAPGETGAVREAEDADSPARPPVRGEPQTLGLRDRPSSGSMGDWRSPNSAAPLGVPGTGGRTDSGPMTRDSEAVPRSAPLVEGRPSPALSGRAASGPQSEAEDSARGLLADTSGYQQRWEGIQTGFVDEPRRAVEQADALVAEVIEYLARTFADERTRLEKAWSGGYAPSTEDLHLSLRRYREFFQVLLRS